MNDNMFELNTLQQGNSRESFIEETENEFGIPTDKSSPTSLDLQRELATIQAMKQGPSGGLGQTIGSLGGTAVGTAFGGPVGGAVGSAVGGTVGSVVDYFIDKDAKEKAEQIRLDALRRERAAMLRREQNAQWQQKLADAKNESIASYNAQANRFEVAKQMQGFHMQQMMNKIANAKSRKNQSRQSYLANRGI